MSRVSRCVCPHNCALTTSTETNTTTPPDPAPPRRRTRDTIELYPSTYVFWDGRRLGAGGTRTGIWVSSGGSRNVDLRWLLTLGPPPSLNIGLTKGTRRVPVDFASQEDGHAWESRGCTIEKENCRECFRVNKRPSVTSWLCAVQCSATAAAAAIKEDGGAEDGCRRGPRRRRRSKGRKGSRSQSRAAAARGPVVDATSFADGTDRSHPVTRPLLLLGTGPWHRALN